MIQPTGLSVLDRLGLADRLLAHGARIDRLFGQAGGRTVLDVRYAALGRAQAFGVGTHRASLFAILHDACRADGIPIQTGRTIRESELTKAGKRRLLFADGRASGSFDLIVDMLGCRSSLAPPCGRELAYGALWASLDLPEGLFDGAALEQRYRRTSVMAGVLPIGTPPHGSAPQAAFFWSLRADRLSEWRERGLDTWKAEVAALWPATVTLLDQIGDPEQLTFTRYAHRTLPKPGEEALIHLGDAWHSASPQLGQGANMALLDAWALARGLRRATSVREAIAETISSRRRHVRSYQWLTALFTPVYQSDSWLLPFARDRIVGPLSRVWPATWIQAAMVSGLIGDPLAPLGLEASAPAPRL